MIDDFRDMNKEVAASHGVPYVDIRLALQRVHPNSNSNSNSNSGHSTILSFYHPISELLTHTHNPHSSLINKHTYTCIYCTHIHIHTQTHTHKHTLTYTRSFQSHGKKSEVSIPSTENIWTKKELGPRLSTHCTALTVLHSLYWTHWKRHGSC